MCASRSSSWHCRTCTRPRRLGPGTTRSRSTGCRRCSYRGRCTTHPNSCRWHRTCRSSWPNSPGSGFRRRLGTGHHSRCYRRHRGRRRHTRCRQCTCRPPSQWNNCRCRRRCRSNCSNSPKLGFPSTSWHGAPQQVLPLSQGSASSHEVPSVHVPPPEPVEQLPLLSHVPAHVAEQSVLGLPSMS